MKKIYTGLKSLLCLTAILGIFVFAACDTEESTDPANGTSSTGITAADLAGTWIATADSPEGPRALFLEFSETNLERIAYESTVQVEGARGTFTVSGDVLTFSKTKEWDETAKNYIDETDTITAPIVLSGNTLTIPHPSGEAGQTLDLTKTVFSQQSALVEAWLQQNVVMNFMSTGVYDYSEVGYAESGTWDATDSYLRAITTEENSAEVSVAFLCAYTLADVEGGKKLTLDYYEEGLLNSLIYYDHEAW
jgi:hypothetical protein